MDCSLPGSSAHGIFQAGVLEWVAIAFSRQGRLTLIYFERRMAKKAENHGLTKKLFTYLRLLQYPSGWRKSAGTWITEHLVTQWKRRLTREHKLCTAKINR